MENSELVKGGCGHTDSDIETSAFIMGYSFVGLIVIAIIGVILS